jgi:uncharacterized damage-inducible protein DinB
MADPYLRRLGEYTSWANRGLVDFVGSLPDEVLDATAPGVYGSVRETLEHLLSSELNYERYLARGEKQEAPYERPDAAALQRLAAQSEATLLRLIDQLPDAEEFMHLGDGNRSAGTIFVQLISHSAEHRAHVGTILGSLGYELQELDSWAHGIFVNGDDWPPDWGPDTRPG